MRGKPAIRMRLVSSSTTTENQTARQPVIRQCCAQELKKHCMKISTSKTHEEQSWRQNFELQVDLAETFNYRIV